LGEILIENETSCSLEERLRSLRAKGRKILVPYVTGGYDDSWLETIQAIAEAGADAIEIGIPFSDPIMDGPIIQAASQQALDRGVTPASIFAQLEKLDIDVPLIAMTYCNLVFHSGFERFGGWLSMGGVTGTIFPDLPLEESHKWSDYAESIGIANILLVAPTTSISRSQEIASASRGFVYGVGLMGVTGIRASLAESASKVASSLKAITDRVVLVGIGISTPQQAKEVAQVSDGVIVGSALVKRLLDGEGPNGAYAFISSLRSGLDDL
jgi:tryptophan synthase alpha chain